MCYPASITVNHELAVNHGEMVVVARRHVVVDGGEVKKQCLCSPTHHPGSFRCRHHHSKYVWVGGRLLAPKPTPTQN